MMETLWFRPILAALCTCLLAASAWSHDSHDHELEARLHDPAAGETEKLIAAARLSQSRHDFATALNQLDRVKAMAGDLDEALLLEAAIHLVLGDPDAAGAACRRLRNVPALVVITCNARVAVALGDARRALATLKVALAQVDLRSADKAWVAWATSVAGDAAKTIDTVTAVGHYRRSLTLQDNPQVRAALADVLIERRRFDEADVAMSAGKDSLALQIRRLIVATHLDDAPPRDRIESLDARFQHWIDHEDWTHVREMARFYLDIVERPDLAKSLAKINLGIQREPEDLLLARRVGLDVGVYSLTSGDT